MRLRRSVAPSLGFRSVRFILYSVAAPLLRARGRGPGASPSTVSTVTAWRSLCSMPRIAVLSGWVTLEPIFLRPSARAVRPWLFSKPIMLLLRVILSAGIGYLLGDGSGDRGRSGGEFLNRYDGGDTVGGILALGGQGSVDNALRNEVADLLAAQASDVGSALELLEGLDRRPGGVYLVRRAERLGENVLDAGQFEDRADGTTGDESGTGRRGLEKDLSGVQAEEDVVRDGGADHGHVHHDLLDNIDALADGIRN